jgi:hypothetical protein
MGSDDVPMPKVNKRPLDPSIELARRQRSQASGFAERKWPILPLLHGLLSRLHPSLQPNSSFKQKR